jgi:hypothetical protein
MFRDDECRVRTDNAPANFTTIKHMALNLIRLKSSGLGRRLLGKSRWGLIFSPDSPDCSARSNVSSASVRAISVAVLRFGHRALIAATPVVNAAKI